MPLALLTIPTALNVFPPFDNSKFFCFSTYFLTTLFVLLLELCLIYKGLKFWCSSCALFLVHSSLTWLTFCVISFLFLITSNNLDLDRYFYRAINLFLTSHYAFLSIHPVNLQLNVLKLQILLLLHFLSPYVLSKWCYPWTSCPSQKLLLPSFHSPPSQLAKPTCKFLLSSQFWWAPP